MRTGWFVVAAGCLLAAPSVCGAQDESAPRTQWVRPLRDDLRSSIQSDQRDPSAIVTQRLLDKLQPVRQRVGDDENFRIASGMVGLGVIAYEGIASGGQLPLGFLGNEALRIALGPQLSALRERTGFTVEPSISYRRFVVTFRKSLD